MIQFSSYIGRIISSIIVCLSIFVSGCSSNIDDVMLNTARQNPSNSNISSPFPNSKLRNAFDASTINPIALQYVDNAKSLLYATGALNINSTELAMLRSVSSYTSLVETEEISEVNPMMLRLQLLDIVDEDTGKPINFYDLPQEQQEFFVDKLLQEDARNISSKLDLIPEVSRMVEVENTATNKLLTKYKIPIMRVGDLSDIKLENTRSINTRKIFRATKNNDNNKKYIDSKEFFLSLRKEIELEMNVKDSRNHTEVRSVGAAVTFNYPEIDVSKIVKPAWIRFARRGDFVLAIPLHSAPWIYANIGKNVKFKVGHAGIIDSSITQNTQEKDTVTIESWSDNGVQRLAMSIWNTPHYIMGVQKVKYKWKWRGFRSGLYKTVTPVSNPDALADWANKYVGRDYVRWYEFPTAKWAAPDRFTCTSLVWWCAKKAYDINISGWYSPLVSPSGLLTDDETYVRCSVS